MKQADRRVVLKVEVVVLKDGRHFCVVARPRLCGMGFLIFQPNEHTVLHGLAKHHEATE